jgi:hypothetical protein
MSETQIPKPKKKPMSPFRRIVLEVAFIVFLFYSNLLMGEYTQSGAGKANGFVWAVKDIFTWENFTIAIVFALIGHLLFDYLLKRRN